MPYLLRALLASTLLAVPALAETPSLPKERIEAYDQFNYGQDTGGHGWEKTIIVAQPAPRSELGGNVVVKFSAPGMTHASAHCWRQPTAENPSPWGHDVNLLPEGYRLDTAGNGSFVFKATDFPHGPANIRIYAHDGKNKKRDVYELQLYNRVGVRWNQGIPKKDPPGAAGLKLVFADDFDGPLSISKDGRGARYNAHKPRFGDFSGWPFSDPEGERKPFSQVDTYLRITGSKDEKGVARTGQIASVDMDGKGFWAKAPAYLECRFTAQSAPGVWAAFWTVNSLDKGVYSDELDIIETYGGVGPGNPNHPGYSVTSHFWRQTNPDGTKKKSSSRSVPMMKLGGKSYWSTTFHTYAVRIGLDDTIYYLDDIEVLRHPTNDVSLERPHCFLVSLALGGLSGWKVDLERYGDATEMYVDYVRVYAEKEIDYALPPQTPVEYIHPSRR